MIINITFKNSGFKICISKTACDGLVIRSIVAAVFLFFLVGFFIIGIILFWYIKFKKFCTLLQLLLSNTLRLKSPAI